ncbi:restriction endonuclease subunit S [Campylobacter vicugnae]|uniref:restriction endonuclease subunit S n=1 Tax=Campylobacter vicugnae TaxID=1660076 RepID=UPI000A32F13B|nr:restriction endonuclease subunit S [Campylobacter sp. RM8970]
MQKPSKLAQIPRIRFAGFTENWERRKFGKLAVRESNCDISSIDMPCVEYEDVIANEGQLNKDISLKEMQKKGIIFDGSQVLFGKLRPYLHNWLNPDFKGVAVGDWWVLRPIELDKNFLYRLIQTQQFDDIANQSAGSKMPRADWNLIAETEFIVPSLIEEQNKIGELFANLDNLITLHQRKVEKLQKIKKSCLQNLFPQNNQSTPKIRFKNFSDEWENKFLWEISSNIYQPQTIQETDFTKFGYDVYGANGIIGKYHSYNHELAQIAIACRGNSCGIVNLTKNKVWITGNAMVINVDSIKNINKIFLYFLLYQTDFSYLITGSGQPQITGNIKNHQCNLPKNLKEQEKIGAFFSKLDKLISLHQRKVEKLKNIKKALLNKMFI